MSPLMKGISKKVISENIRREMHAGKNQKQTIAISINKAKKSYQKKTKNGTKYSQK